MTLCGMGSEHPRIPLILCLECKPYETTKGIWPWHCCSFEDACTFCMPQFAHAVLQLDMIRGCACRQPSGMWMCSHHASSRLLPVVPFSWMILRKTHKKPKLPKTSHMNLTWLRVWHERRFIWSFLGSLPTHYTKGKPCSSTSNKLYNALNAFPLSNDVIRPLSIQFYCFNALIKSVLKLYSAV